MSPDTQSVATALERIRRRIEKAARAAGRDPADVTLTAVSKQSCPLKS